MAKKKSENPKQAAGQIALSENESKKMLAQYGIPVVKEAVAATGEQAVSLATQIGYPVVLKGMGASLLHKTERGLVHLNLTGENAVKAAAEAIVKEAGSELEGLLVQPYLTGKREFVAGLFQDRQFGPVVMFGLGGVFTEALSDVSFRIAPLSKADAQEMICEIRAAALLGAFRGEQAVNRSQLIDTLMGLSKIGVAHPDIAEIDINPLLVSSDGSVCAVDALIVKRTVPAKSPFTPHIAPELIRKIFYPKSIAFIGASGQLGKWGHRLVVNTISGGFEGDIHLVNPKGGAIMGRTAYPSIADIPGTVDLGVVTIPAAGVMALFPQFQAKGIKYMVLITSGFRETGEEGKLLEKQIVEAARQAGVLMLGPNTMGITNPHINLSCSGTAVNPKPGATAIVSQSGNMGVQLIDFADDQDIGIRGFAGSGNEAMITIEDYLDAFEMDDLTSTVIIYIESVKNGRRFFESARRVGLKKPIVLLKGGQTKAGEKAASSHTGAMTSDTRVFNAVCKQSGIVKVDHTMDMLDLAASFSSLPLPRGNRVAIMTLGGGWGVVTADLCAKYHLDVPDLSPEIIERINKILPPYWSKANPIDIVGEGGLKLPITIIEELIKWDGCDAVINLGIVGRTSVFSGISTSIMKADPGHSLEFLDGVQKALGKFEEDYTSHIVKLMEQHHKPVIGVSITPNEKNKTVFKIEGYKHKAIFFPTPERAVKSLSKMTEYQRFLVRESGKSTGC